MPTYDQLSATTRADIQQGVVQDNLFVEDGLQKVVRYYANEDVFTGGISMQVPYLYDRPTGGASVPGSTRLVIDKPLLAAMAFSEREYIEEIPLNEWELKVINAGPNAAVSIYDAKMEAAVRAFNTDWNVDAYRHGQASGTGVAQDLSIHVNGMDEFLNDGVNPGWMGNWYPTIGGETRNATPINNVLNSIPLWGGDLAGNLGQVNYGILMDAYLQCVQAPDTGLCNKELFRLILMREEPKQRFTQETDPRIGITGVRLMDATIHVDKLAPSTRYGLMLPSQLYPSSSLGTTAFTTSNLTTAAQVAISRYPINGVTCQVGEPFFLLRLKDWKFRPSQSAEFRHYFKGPIPSQEAPDLEVMFYREALNWYTPSPRDNKLIVGLGQ